MSTMELDNMYFRVAATLDLNYRLRTSRPSHMAYTDSSIQNADVTSSDDDTNIQSLFNSSNDSMSQI